LEFVHAILAVVTDLPGHLNLWIAQMGLWIYLLLFLIIFAETGLIVTPFLPGDSLLFALGALCATGSLSLTALLILLIMAAIIGDAVNYSIGRWLGLRLFTDPKSKIFNPNHLHRTQAFYERHGGKTIILARFIPIIRTYAPFVAGLARMKYSQFGAYNIFGGIAWVAIFLIAGFQFGNLPEVKSNFHYVIAAIIVISALPAVIEFLRARRHIPAAPHATSEATEESQI
jgi:membrane-associated protein